MDVLALVSGLAACDPETADRDELVASVEASARVRAWLDGFDIEVGRALEAKTGYGAKVFADAANVSVALSNTDAIRVRIVDDGKGFDPDAPRRRGFGLTSMRERAEVWGGRLVVKSRPGEGTEVEVVLP